MADEVDLLSTGCLEHSVNEVGHESCRGVDVATGLSGFHKRMCFRVVVERVGAESCCLEAGTVVRPRDEGVLGCARDEHDGMGAFPRFAGEVVGARDFRAGVLHCEPDCRGPAGHTWPLNIRGDSVGAVRRVTPPGCSGVMSVGGLAKAVVVVPMAIIIVARRVVSNQFFFMDLLRCICGCWLSCRQGARCWPHDDVWGPRYEGPTVGMGRYQVISR